MTAIAINSNSWPRVPLIYLHLTSLSARHSVPDAHTFGASSCLPCPMMSGLRRIPSIYGFHELKSTDLSLSRGKRNWHPCFRLSPPFLSRLRRLLERPRVFIVLNHRRAKQKPPRKNGRTRTRFIFSITSIVYRRGADASGVGVCVCVCLPARHRRRPVFGGETSGCLEIDFPPTIVCIFFAPGCFPVLTADTWPRNFPLFLLLLRAFCV